MLLFGSEYAKKKKKKKRKKLLLDNLGYLGCETFVIKRGSVHY